MKYQAPTGAIDPEAPYITGRPGIQKGSAVPAEAIEHPQREIVNAITMAGLDPNDSELDQLAQAIRTIARQEVERKEMQRYELCEFYTFRHPILRPGFQPATGGLVEQAATRYPEAWAYLQSEEGKFLCKTEAEWQAMTQASWHTLADGSEIGWEGIGGAPFFAPDFETGALRLPDVRGMYAEAAGFDGLGVGGVHGDGIRRITGSFYNDGELGNNNLKKGAFYLNGVFANSRTPHTIDTSNTDDVGFDSALVVPSANKNQPRAWGALACVYLGQPAAQ